MRVAYQGHSTEDIWYRYMIVRDRAPNGSTASVTNVLSSASVQSHRNLDYTKRFTVLSDRVLYLPAGGNSVDGGFTQLYLDLEKITKGNKKGKQKNETNYGLGNAGTVADISENAYYLLMVSSAASNEPTFSWDIRLRYIDN